MKLNQDSYRTIFFILPEPVAVSNSKGELLDANRSFLDQFSIHDIKKNPLNIFDFLNINKEQKKLLLKDKILHIAHYVNKPVKNSFRDKDSVKNSEYYRITLKAFEFSEKDGLSIIAFFYPESSERKPDDKVNNDIGFFKQIIDKVPAAVFVQINGKFAYLNDSAVRLFGADNADKILGTDVIDRIHPGFREKISARIRNINETGRANPVLDEIYLKMDGTAINVEVSDSLFSYNGEQGAIVFVNDITKRKYAENGLAKSSDKMRGIFHTAPVGIGVMEGTVIKEVNDRLCGMTGYGSDEFINRDIEFLFSGRDEYDRFRDFFLNNNNSIKPAMLDTLWKRQNGEIIYVAFRQTMINREENSQTIFTATDITERKQHQDKIQLLSGIADAAPVIIFIHDIAGNILYANEQAIKAYGYSRDEFMNLHLHSLVGPGDVGFIPLRRQKILDLGEASFEIDQIKKDGTIIPMRSNVRIIEWEGRKAVLSVSTDLTEQKLTEEYVGRSQKLESLGVLAGGIAHDFNNMLGVLFGYLNLAMMTSSEAEVIDYLEKAATGFDRAKSLTQQLLTFSKGGSPVRKILSIASLLKECAGFALSGSNIKVKFEIPDDLWLCEFDENQMGQLIDNILINAQQAMPSGGTIAISASNVNLKIDEYPSLDSGNYVKIAIMDTGHGIPENILPNIFDPFFTTKKSGNGLGLATAYSIIKKHNGDIFVKSRTDAGTTFYVMIPASTEMISTDSMMNKKEHKGSGRILIMDDDPSIRHLTGEILKSMGYETESAKDGDEALMLYKKAFDSNNPFDAVFLDLTIPGGRGGDQVVNELRNLDTEMVAFAMSGYSDNPVMSDPGKFAFTGRLFKPFMSHDIAELLNKHMPEERQKSVI